MPATYEFWLTDDTGRRMGLLTNCTFFSYSRSVNGFGTFEIGLPYRVVRDKLHPIFQPDWRIDVWRSPETGYPMRREQIYLLRMYKIYTREKDGVQIIVYYARDPKDLVNRRWVIQAAGTSYTRKTAAIDDMMKEIVREQTLYGSAVDVDGVSAPERAWPEAEWSVQEDLTLGPSVTHNFAENNVLDVLKSLRDASFELANRSTANAKIYFDVVATTGLYTDDEILQENDASIFILDENGTDAILAEISGTANGKIGFRFETYAGLRGIDRTTGLVFSVENNNLEAPYYSKSHFDENNSVIVKGFGRGDSRLWDVVDGDTITLSRWNRVETYKDASTEPDQDKLADFAYEPLNKNAPREELSAVFLNTPGSEDTPRSLYGLDWDMGDLVPVEYAEQRWNVEIDIVYIAQDENGVETITGRSNINASDQT